MPRLCHMPILESISNFLSRSLFQLPFYRQFVAHFIAFFSWNCGWLTFQERDQLKMQSVVIE